VAAALPPCAYPHVPPNTATAGVMSSAAHMPSYGVGTMEGLGNTCLAQPQLQPACLLCTLCCHPIPPHPTPPHPTPPHPTPPHPTSHSCSTPRALYSPTPPPTPTHLLTITPTHMYTHRHTRQHSPTPTPTPTPTPHPHPPQGGPAAPGRRPPGVPWSGLCGGRGGGAARGTPAGLHLRQPLQ
jgi:hypothetical protein